mmetsp:Transcript_6940/g.11579  ORF Transcript_6940/g.11579 Transcript_6940/m.11579 type:complete len:364 (-) Transcript_6940:318-1409(-)
MVFICPVWILIATIVLICVGSAEIANANTAVESGSLNREEYLLSDATSSSCMATPTHTLVHVSFAENTIKTAHLRQEKSSTSQHLVLGDDEYLAYSLASQETDSAVGNGVVSLTNNEKISDDEIPKMFALCLSRSKTFTFTLLVSSVSPTDLMSSSISTSTVRGGTLCGQYFLAVNEPFEITPAILSTCRSFADHYLNGATFLPRRILQTSDEPTSVPSSRPTQGPTFACIPTSPPSSPPSSVPTSQPSIPTSHPSSMPSIPSSLPTSMPSRPTAIPTIAPSPLPTPAPSRNPTVAPTAAPSFNETTAEGSGAAQAFIETTTGIATVTGAGAATVGSVSYYFIRGAQNVVKAPQAPLEMAMQI